MGTNIVVLLLLAFDFGAMPHCVPLRYLIRVYSRPFVVNEFGLFPANRCLSLSSPCYIGSDSCFFARILPLSDKSACVRLQSPLTLQEQPERRWVSGSGDCPG